MYFLLTECVMELLVKRRMCQMVLYLLHFLVLFIQESNSQGGFCRQNKPVLKFCNPNKLTNLTDVNIDTSSIPKYQETVCECTIFSYIPGVMFMFSYYGQEVVPRNMVFKINNASVSSKATNYVWNTDRATLLLRTTKNYTIEGTCLIVSTDNSSRFNITCMKSNISTTISSTSSTLDGSVTPTGQVTDTETESYTEDTKDTGGNKFIIPIVAALSGLVVLVIVIVVIIVYRRRSTKKKGQSATSSSYVEKEDDNDYYMTENPMYNATDILPKAQNSDNEYHYTVHDNHRDRMSANQYESFPDSPLRKQGAAKETDKEEHYDYSTCLSNSQKGLSAVVNEQTLATKSDGTLLPKNQSADIENTYDRTDKLAKPFVGENEYHHLTPAGSRKKTALDTYNTVGSVVDNKHEQEEDGEDSEYHVTSLR